MEKYLKMGVFPNRPRHLLISLVVISLLYKARCDESPPKLILISMDSLMFKFLENLPSESIQHFQYIIDHGVLLKQMTNVFPSSTYPNHYTLITGLYPESHGMVSNKFYDPKLNESFSISVGKDNYDTKWFDTGAEPIYVTNNKAGGVRRSGTVLFPTGLAKVKGIHPDRMVEDDGTYPNMYKNYEFPYLDMPYKDRIDRMMSWFTDKKYPINLGLLYFPEPDELSHKFGPDSKEVRREITGPLNDVLGYLISKLRAANLMDSTNLIVTADHGQTQRRRFVFLNDYVDPNAYTYKGSIAAFIYPKAGKEEEVFRNLSRAEGIKVFKRDSPEMRSIHLSNNDRIAPIIATGSEGIVMTQTVEGAKKYSSIGVHGYDPQEVPSMRPVFMAMGPGFKKGVVSKHFHMVDVYPLMCHLLDVTPAPCNGSLDNVRHLLVYTSGNDDIFMSISLMIGGLLIQRSMSNK